MAILKQKLEAHVSGELVTLFHQIIAMGIYRLSALRSILEKGLDSQPIPSPQPDLLGQLEHQNIRGNRYYH
ncbi:sensory box-containing diguanylate cyclase family protein [Candidatus Regiella insecticola 5.15]|uniref:Sensory box-containing diguanylate cyclase family protein n=1 Tax=Candidatus Regiella insecticola 5.15 TaxID=1005043 RepID=G2H1I4_9ENTR|nr:hypothetical protein [Candidatus Regiella insecticola]EGY28142.1 sensory box-containing diguanylate cyclase family protein [Candidatus Regiella insecticola 5.15]